MKIINSVISCYLKSRIQKKPPVLRIETTNLCNANCTTCPRSKMKRKTGVMEMELYKSLIDQAYDMGVTKVHLHNYGEPLLDKTLIEKIAYAKEKEMKPKIFTNAALMTEEISRKIIEAGIDEVKISMDGVTKETFESIRKKLIFEEVIQGIENLIKARGDLKSPKVSLVFVALEKNRHEAEMLKEKWKARVDSIHITCYHNWANEEMNKKTFLEKVQAKIPCARLWRTMTVLMDGRVALCCLDYDGEVILGDSTKEALSDIWQGKSYKQLRRLHVDGNQKSMKLCQNCTIGRL
ncbi:MAG: radical SAM protein [Candidatus Aureabacteria bacterium]|nr:radical SAM protein [Candidatus Auribacterota bacterium]